jgi:hypothetical protein
MNRWWNLGSTTSLFYSRKPSAISFGVFLALPRFHTPELYLISPGNRYIVSTPREVHRLVKNLGENLTTDKAFLSNIATNLKWDNQGDEEVGRMYIETPPITPSPYQAVPS